MAPTRRIEAPDYQGPDRRAATTYDPEAGPTTRDVLVRIDTLEGTIREAATVAQAWVSVLGRIVPETWKGWAFLVCILLAPQLMGLAWAVAASSDARDAVVERVSAIP
jgi:hypothetical protein